MIDSLPEEAVGVMDRICWFKVLQNAADSNKYFVLRIGNKYKLEFTQESESVWVGTGKEKRFHRIIQFCALETKLSID